MYAAHSLRPIGLALNPMEYGTFLLPHGMISLQRVLHSHGGESLRHSALKLLWNHGHDQIRTVGLR